MTERVVEEGTVNAGRNAFEAAIRDLGGFLARSPDPLRSLISGRHAVEDHRALLLGRPGGIKHVLAFGEAA